MKNVRAIAMQCAVRVGSHGKAWAKLVTVPARAEARASMVTALLVPLPHPVDSRAEFARMSVQERRENRP